MDWSTGADGTTEAIAGDGARWLIRPAESVTGGFALFRLPTGATLPDEVDEEEHGVGVLRSLGEAQVMALLLTGRADPRLKPGKGFKTTFETEDRRGWRLDTPDGYLSLFHGSDEDRRDVVVQRFSLRTPGQIGFVLIVSHGRKAHMPASAAPLPAALALIDLVTRAGRLDSPLEPEDATLWAAGRPVRPAADRPEIPAGPDSPPAIAAAAVAFEREGVASESLREAALEIVRFDGAAPNAVREELVGRSLALQYVLVAAFRGAEVADELVAAGRSPVP